MLLTLAGLEQLVKFIAHRTGDKINFIGYADDFVIIPITLIRCGYQGEILKPVQGTMTSHNRGYGEELLRSNGKKITHFMTQLISTIGITCLSGGLSQDMQ